jgi:predicted RNase H-like HicB family nuclease
MTYTIVIEQGPTGFSAFSPDIPGVIATARTLAKIKRFAVEAIAFHLEGLGDERPAFPGPDDEPVFVLEPAVFAVDKGDRRALR